MPRVAIAPRMLQWARERAGLEPEDLLSRIKKYQEWETEKTKPTLKQLEKFAKAVHVPIGVLFLPEPPEEHLSIPDFRTLNNAPVSRPSPNLFDVLYNCQERQAWYKEFAQIMRQEPRSFIGSANFAMKPEDAAMMIRNTLGFTMEARQECRTWEDALRFFIQQCDQLGILVMVSGVVLSNNNRKLDPKEFRGFALSDALAPLIFINGSDSKSGQMFTLAHELAHLWVNSTGVSNASANPLNGFPREEVWCNSVAAELLVPLEVFLSELIQNESLAQAKTRLSKKFKVSTLVILRRLLDAGWF